jgi:hypothetical protein
LEDVDVKSAFERALERFGGEERKYTAEQKQRLAEIDKLYDAKVAQARFEGAQRLGKAGAPTTVEAAAKLEKMRDEIAIEVASINRKRDAEKDTVRQQGA